ncbi:MAG: hypothetical protein ACI39H_04605 [Lachnospiraceae bacterium]
MKAETSGNLELSDTVIFSSVQKNRKMRIISIVMIVVILLIAISGGLGYLALQKLNSDEREKSLVYTTYDGVYYVENMDRDEEPCLISRIDDQCMDDFEHYECRPRIIGDYVYFFNKINSDGYGCFCRIRMSDIQKDLEKNEQHIEEIDTAVRKFYALVDDIVVFLNEYGELVYVDEEKPIVMDHDVTEYSWSKNKEVVWYLAEQGSDIYRLAYYSLSEGIAGTVDESTYFEWSCSDDGKEVVYLKFGEKDSDLYLANTDGEREVIASNVNSTVGILNTESVFYTKLSDKEGTNTEPGDEIQMPEKIDYLHPTSEEYVLENCNILYFADHPEEIYYYLYDDEETKLENLMYIDWEEAATTPFYYDSQTEQWYEFLEVEYYEAVEYYENTMESIGLWGELEHSLEENKETDLYQWSKKVGEKKIDSDIQTEMIRTDENGRAIFYRKKSMDSSQDGDFSKDDGLEYWFYMDKKPDRVIADGEIDDFFISDDLTRVMVSVSDEKDKIIEYEIKNGQLNRKGCIAENTDAGKWVEGRFYYFKDVENYVGTFCYYEGQKETVIAEKMEEDLIFFYENGEISYTGTCIDDHVPLNIINKNNENIEVERTVREYIYVNEDRIVYSKNSRLYVFSREKTKMIVPSMCFFDCAEKCPYQTEHFM